MATDLRVVLITIDSLDAGRTLAKFLVQEKLAACVNLVPQVESIYTWEGQLQQESEVLLIAKTTALTFPQLEAAVKSRHSYTTPEILALSVTDASQAYAFWVMQGVSPWNQFSPPTES